MKTKFFILVVGSATAILTLALSCKKIFSGELIGNSDIACVLNDSITLKEAYADYFPIGTATNGGKWYNDSLGKGFIAKQYASLTGEYQMKIKALQPTEGNYNWYEADKLVNFAAKNNLKVRGHCLLWSNNTPDWFFKNGSVAASRDLVLQRLKSHIDTVMKRYKGKTYCWDVVNESVSKDPADGQFKKDDRMFRIVGEDYVAKAFEYARAADPDAVLFYNDIDFEDAAKSERIYTLVKKLKDAGVPIDGVGIQCHLDIKDDPEFLLRKNIKRYADLGLKVQITELDISIYDHSLEHRPDLPNDPEIYTPEIEAKQVAMFDAVFRVCRENRNTVTGITLWGPADGPNYLETALKKKNYPFLFTDQLKPKKAFFKVVNF